MSRIPIKKITKIVEDCRTCQKRQRRTEDAIKEANFWRKLWQEVPINIRAQIIQERRET